MSRSMVLNKLLVHPKRIIKALLRRVLSFINSQPRLRRYVLAIINRLGLYDIACRLHARLSAALCRSGPYSFIPTDAADLGPHALHIYSDLKTAIERGQKEKA